MLIAALLQASRSRSSHPRHHQRARRDRTFYKSRRAILPPSLGQPDRRSRPAIAGHHRRCCGRAAFLGLPDCRTSTAAATKKSGCATPWPSPRVAPPIPCFVNLNMVLEVPGWPIRSASGRTMPARSLWRIWKAVSYRLRPSWRGGLELGWRSCPPCGWRQGRPPKTRHSAGYGCAP